MTTAVSGQTGLEWRSGGEGETGEVIDMCVPSMYSKCGAIMMCWSCVVGSILVLSSGWVV